MSGQIFISYRRDDNPAWARSLYDRLSRRFGENQVFRDVDGVGLGKDFVETIERRVGECDVLIAVIGARWLTSTDPQGRRLDNPEDFVRMEIGTALRRNIRVIPVLVDGALMPRSTDLPDDLKRLARRNALQIGDTHFDDDCRRLSEAIEEVLEEKAADLRTREEKERLERELRVQPPPVAPLTPSDRSKEDEAPGQTSKAYPLAPKPTEPERGFRSDRVARKSPLKQLFAFLGIAGFIVVCGIIVYLGIKAPRSPSQPSADQTTPVAVAIPSPSISATPTKEELVRTALDTATKENPWVNSQGMKFVPVAGTQVLFGIWDTRVQDFEAFVKDTGYNATRGMYSFGRDGWKQRGDTWKEPGFSQGANHPVVGVSWNDAKEFCKWLTRRERTFGNLPLDREYRLPTDEEWSLAVGLKNEAGSTPAEKDGKIKLYPWDIEKKSDKSWPPPWSWELCRDRGEKMGELASRSIRY